jgi:hypothetical protein
MGNLYARSYISILDVFFVHINVMPTIWYEIRNTQNSIKSKTACGYDEISSKLFKYYIGYISMP